MVGQKSKHYLMVCCMEATAHPGVM